MKTLLRTEKFDWLKQHGYSIVANYGKGWTATNKNTGLRLQITDKALRVFSKPPIEITGWLELDIHAFMLRTISHHIVEPTAEERDEMQLIFNEHYTLPFTNDLS